MGVLERKILFNAEKPGISRGSVCFFLQKITFFVLSNVEVEEGCADGSPVSKRDQAVSPGLRFFMQFNEIDSVFTLNDHLIGNTHRAYPIPLEIGELPANCCVGNDFICISV